jgi:hypothetical protein
LRRLVPPVLVLELLPVQELPVLVVLPVLELLPVLVLQELPLVLPLVLQELPLVLPLVLAECLLVQELHYHLLQEYHHLLLAFLEQLVLSPLNFSLLTHPLALCWLQILHFSLVLVVAELTQMRLLVMIPSHLLLTPLLQ